MRKIMTSKLLIIYKNKHKQAIDYPNDFTMQSICTVLLKSIVNFGKCNSILIYAINGFTEANSNSVIENVSQQYNVYFKFP